MTARQRASRRRDRHAEWTLTEAKAQFSSVVQDALEGKPQRIIRNGREVVVVVAAEAYDAAMKPRRSLVELFSALRGAEIEIDRPKDDTREVPEF